MQPKTARAAYPATSYQAHAVPVLSDPAVRRRLSASAAKGFLRIMERWKVRDEDARGLLGGMSHGSYYQMKQNPGAKPFDQDRLLRISYLLGIFKALNILHSTELADQWMQLGNRNPIFAGKSPLEFVLAGGTPALHTVRRLLDARRGGH